MGPCSDRVCGGGAGSTASCPAGSRSFCARAAGLDLLPPGRRGRRAQQDGPRRPSGGPWAGPGTQPSSSALCGSSRGCADLRHVGVRASCASDKGEETQGPPGGNRPGLGGDWAGRGGSLWVPSHPAEPVSPLHGSHSPVLPMPHPLPAAHEGLLRPRGHTGASGRGLSQVGTGTLSLQGLGLPRHPPLWLWELVLGLPGQPGCASAG